MNFVINTDVSNITTLKPKALPQATVKSSKVIPLHGKRQLKKLALASVSKSIAATIRWRSTVVIRIT